MTEEKFNEILEIVKSIQNSPAMNGAFDKLVSSVEDIKNSQNQVASDVSLVKLKQEESNKRIEELYNAIYDPDLGIYKRINDSINVGLNQEDHLKRIDDKLGGIDGEIINHNSRLAEVETTRENLIDVAGERLENLDSTIKMNKNVNKLFWAGVAAVAGFILKELGPTLLGLLL